MYKKRDTVIFDAAVERVMSEVLHRLEDCDAGLTIAPADDHSYLLTHTDLLRDLSIFAEVFDAEVEEEPSALVVKFRNGQTFRISVEEEKRSEPV